ncbi:MAG: 4-hydroxythreonine-4-phosphate dehydrogenase PdxA [Gammaproteobacteria bacterium]|nr:4-hydroxythreonine-4-phosphate dehydrogenase PdxA [Gammaproteobacteria bacterium]
MAEPLPVVFTPGEPAGIGPDLALMMARDGSDVPWVAIADPDLMAARARRLDIPVEVLVHDAAEPPPPTRPGVLRVVPVPCPVPVVPGHLDPRNGAYVLETLAQAVDGCLAGDFAALVTGPVHKGNINESGVAFTGHTEFLAARCGVPQVVMMLVGGNLRVALVTTHLPLAEVPRHITPERLEAVVRILVAELGKRCRLPHPAVRVLGLNPHAGEGGHLGMEEIEVIEPVLNRLRAEGMRLEGPVPADTAFTPAGLADVDVVLAMYHDQGLPVLKHVGFGAAVNVTLGLPFVRTSVDHGTALALAGSGHIDDGSLKAAMALAASLSG